ncbi:MAG: thioredoxin family protein [Epsilonproteobacteria bacterium]|nr:thioredoxin family protein [Campylobacterota bacterium]
MKQLKYFLLLWLLPLWLLSNHVHWMGDYDNALQLAHKEEKPLVVLVVKKDSKICNKILHQQFMNQPYIGAINDKMIAVMVTYEGKLSYPIEMYYTTVFPTLFFVDTKSETFMKEPLYGEGIEMGALKKIILTM